MTENTTLKQFLDQLSSVSDEENTGGHVPNMREQLSPIGQVLEIAGSGSQIRMDPARLNALASHADPSVSMSGQVGSQVKMAVGSSWLIANVRTMRSGEDGSVLAAIDFLGEGTMEAGGSMGGFRRGVTRYPIPGALVHPVTTEDLRQVFAASDSAHVEIGTVYPTDDIRGALYIDPMLSKHFAILGSTGTGKSTSVALILHRISQYSPEGHIVMIDPHGE
jgi:hypothetical protein